MKIIVLIILACMFLVAQTATGNEVAVLSSSKAELMGRVEDFFLHNFRDITWRKSLQWGDVVQTDDAGGARSIAYRYEARIWDKETLVIEQVFTFAADGTFVRYTNSPGFPQKKSAVAAGAAAADVTTQKGMIALVEDFFSKNFRDITARQTIEWGPLARDAKGNSTIRYKYNATIRGKEQKVLEQAFTFDAKGTFVSVTDVKEN